MVRPDGPTETFLNRYAEFAADPAPSGLRHHYVAYRAVVRAKVALLRHDQGEPHAAADATAHLELALRHLRDGAVRLALVGGLPATGKTTLGGAIADRFGAVLLSSDRLRGSTRPGRRCRRRRRRTALLSGLVASGIALGAGIQRCWAWLLVRRLTMAANCARWEREWAAVGPVWSGHGDIRS